MIVSWNWLKEYVRLDMPVETLADRLMMAGLNLESITDVEGDIAVDLEVTSNRPDCLGHLGIAREVGALYEREVKVPAAQPVAKGPPTGSLTSVEIQPAAGCPQYMARVVRGVKVGPSPAWLQRRLETLGIRPINNVVDVTNYVLMECGQPLHAFDFDKLHGGRIVVRQAAKGERVVAIDQRAYDLQPEMCVIADADRPVAIAGVMGGLDTEIGAATRNVLIEVAEFAPLSVRNTARRLGLFSDSSYRFERGLDRYNLDWASRRCAELILETAGGELCEGAVFAGTCPAAQLSPITLRFAQLRRILGIDVPPDEAVKILESLGVRRAAEPTAESCQFTAPTWRRDLTREIDLIEEVARIHGYHQIPEDVLVPLEVSTPPLDDRLADRFTSVLLAAGFFEAVTLTFVDEKLHSLFQPWTKAPPLRVEHSTRQRENLLRQSLVPSLLAARRQNERHGNFNAELYEIARIYLAAEPGNAEAEPTVAALVSGKSFGELKGLIEGLADAVNHRARVTARPCDLPQFTPGRGCELLLEGKPWGWLGELSDATRSQLDLHDPVSVAEFNLAPLKQIADIAPAFVPLPHFPAIERDINFVLDEPVTWQEVEQTARAAAGPLLDTLAFDSQYRGPQIPPNKKSYVLRLQYRSPDRTLTAEEVDAIQERVLTACRDKLGAVQR